MIPSCASRSAVTDTIAGKRLPSCADVGQFVDVFDPREALNTSASKPGEIGGIEFQAERPGPLDQFLRDRRYRPA